MLCNDMFQNLFFALKIIMNKINAKSLTVVKTKYLY